MPVCPYCRRSVKAHFNQTLDFRKLTIDQMKSSIGAMTKHLNQAKRIYRERRSEQNEQQDA